ncbi:hypothetical protein PIIN_00965 [Serendipita indica DSM 11827]|uniref:MARVEL domain-containing protein n=1 Tax=Serendipita indica (strain DSM 11827) TaxID=1109443 RepID=G4T798_SERID|nr:hypothetical protein PIIN_00965 [Serendipita indica DSM 11827]
MSYTCCLTVPIRAGAVTISVLGVMASAAFGVVYAREIEDGIMTTSEDHPMAKFVPYVGMVSWMFLALISLFGCIACYRTKPKLATIYFWALLVQYVVDLAFLVVTMYFCITSAQTKKRNCDLRAQGEGFSHTDALCSAALSASSILLLSVLGVYKLYATYAVYVIFNFMRWVKMEWLEIEAQKVQKIMQQRQPQPMIDYDSYTATKNWSKFED